MRKNPDPCAASVWSYGCAGAHRGSRPVWRLSFRPTLALLPALVLICGCPLPQTDDPNNPIVQDSDDNSSLNSPTLAIFGTGSSSRTINGSITVSDDVDVYLLGPMSAGDRLIVDVRRTSGDLDPVAALFDQREFLVAFNDDRAADGSNLNPRLDIVIRESQPNFFIAITNYPGTNNTGNYTVDASVERAVGVPIIPTQIVYLNWQGGNNITVPNVGTFNLPVFSATDVGRPASETAALKQRVQQIVEERYAGYNIAFLSSDVSPAPAVAHSTVHFGGRDLDAFAISEKIDTFNQDLADDTIIFTQSYRDAFRRTPTFEEIAQALGNTVAHELGHLLGLVHTQDCADLMDTTCSNDRILDEQSFTTALLDDSVFPFGSQPSAEILSWVLGLITPL